MQQKVEPWMQLGFEHLPDAATLSVAVRDQDGTAVDMRLIYMNARARAGQPDADAAIGGLCSELWPQMLLNGSFDACMRVLNGGEPESGEFRWTETETYAPAGYDYRASRLGDGILMWVLRDSTAVVDRMAQHERRFHAAFEAAPAGMAVVDQRGTIVLANASLAAMSARTCEDLPGTALVDLVAPTSEAALTGALTAARTQDAPLVDDEVLLASDPSEGTDDRWARVSVARVSADGAQDGWCIVHFLDITAQKALEASLTYEAMHDRMTGLANRGLFSDRLALALARLQRSPGGAVAVLFVDVDHFKVVNDALGHVAGDDVLRAIAARLAGLARASDAVARFGGDEFVVLCEGLTSPTHALTIARRIQSAFRQPFISHGQSLTVTLSIGIAVTSSPSADPQSLLRDADIAMYRAKQDGRDHIVMFDDTLRERAMKRLSLELALRKAVQRDELYLEYQPIVRLADGQMTGVEALVRWRHPDLGPLTPSQFIDLAEETGLIVPVGTWVLEHACQQLSEWQRHPRGAELHMAVNVSARQIYQVQFADVVASAIARAAVDPSALTIELTETTVMSNADTAVLMLHSLRDLGCRISIDDFGTGYSSLSYLRDFPIDTLKIDRSFVRLLGERSEDSALCSAIIRLADALSLTTVAEGVETAEQLGRLTELGCAHAQGYYFSKPVDAGAIDQLLAECGWAMSTAVS